MKKIFSLLPAALGLIALTSCSSDDLFGDSNATVDLSDKLVVTVTEEDDAVTRATRDVNSKVAYEAGDLLRVYDSKLQAYDNFEYAEAGLEKPTFILSADEANVGKREDGLFDYAYAIFGSPDIVDPANVSYAGWQDGENIALLKIQDAITHAEGKAKTATGDNQVVYTSTLPQWGTVEPVVSEVTKTGKSFNTSLRYLSGRAKVVFENGANNGTPVTNVRVTSLTYQSGYDADDLATATATLAQKDDLGATGFVGTYSTLVTATGATPIAGWFEAVLDPDKENDGLRQIQSTINQDAVNVASGNVIAHTISSGTLTSYTNVFYFPIVPDTYDVLAFEYSDDGGASWKFIDYLADYEVARGQKIETDGTIDLTVSNDLIVNVDYMQNCEAVSKVMSDNTITEAPVIINLNLGTPAEYVKTIDSDVESQYTIYIPQLKNNMTVNFTTKTILNKKLVIKDVVGADNNAYTVKFNFSSFTNDKDIEINSTAQEVVLEGNYSALATEAVNVIGGNVTVKADDNATTIINLVNTGTGNIAVDGDDTNALSITKLDAGTATKVTVDGDATLTTITNLNNEDCADVEISGGTVANVNLDAAATITVNGDGVVSNIANANDGALDADVAITINSADNGIISAFATQNPTSTYPGECVYTLSTEFTENTTITSATQPASNEIYTAAQLNSIAGWSNAATLMTAFTVTSGTWTSPNIKVDFDGNDMSITNLNAPLFGEIQTAVTSIENLNISGADITATAANTGVLAKVSKASSLAVTNSTVAGTISSEYNFVGGLIGQVDASAADAIVVFGTNSAASGAAATVTANVTLMNTKEYTSTDVLDVTAGTWGEYVGSVVGAGTNTAQVVVNFDCAGATTAHTASALMYNWKRDADFDTSYRVQILGYLKPTDLDNSEATRQWIGFAGTATAAIPVVAPTDISNMILTYPMTVNGVVSKVTFPNTTSTAYGDDGTTYTFAIDGLDHNDESGLKDTSTSPYTSVIYHNAYTATAY